MAFPTTANPTTADRAVTTRELNARERAHAVETIEAAERSVPYCRCGAHMLAVADASGDVWLECSERGRERNVLQAAFAWLTGGAHARRMIMERPGR